MAATLRLPRVGGLRRACRELREGPGGGQGPGVAHPPRLLGAGGLRGWRAGAGAGRHGRGARGAGGDDLRHRPAVRLLHGLRHGAGGVHHAGQRLCAWASAVGA